MQPSSQQFDLYNAADYLIEPNLVGARADKIAIIDDDGSYSYAEVSRRANRFANVLAEAGIEQEQRVLLCLLDGVDFVACFLGALKAGVVPIPASTMLTGQDYNYLLADSRARMLVVSEPLRKCFDGVGNANVFLKSVLVSGATVERDDCLAKRMNAARDDYNTAPTRRDDVAFWLYTSGTTGKPKGVMHLHGHLQHTAESYAQTILAIGGADRTFSAAKLFFAYGLGNALTFPFSVGATTILAGARATPDLVKQVIDEREPTLFFGVPTLYAMMLNTGNLPTTGKHALRLCVSAGEALPESILSRWTAEVGIEILDGIGSTELLHIFMSNRAGKIRPGTSGKPVDGYQAKLLDENAVPVKDDELGNLFISGPSCSPGYWNMRARTLDTFDGRWMRTGDKYLRDSDGYYHYAGRSDDLLKVGGIYVSPMEVENVLLKHRAVAEAAVVGATDKDDLVKPRAYVVVSADGQPGEDLERELITFVRAELADYKRPRWIEFIDDLPKTATGKIQRFKLRAG